MPGGGAVSASRLGTSADERFLHARDAVHRARSCPSLCQGERSSIFPAKPSEETTSEVARWNCTASTLLSWRGGPTPRAETCKPPLREERASRSSSTKDSSRRCGKWGCASSGRSITCPKCSSKTPPTCQFSLAELEVQSERVAELWAKAQDRMRLQEECRPRGGAPPAPRTPGGSLPPALTSAASLHLPSRLLRGVGRCTRPGLR